MVQFSEKSIYTSLNKIGDGNPQLSANKIKCKFANIAVCFEKFELISLSSMAKVSEDKYWAKSNSVIAEDERNVCFDGIVANKGCSQQRVFSDASNLTQLSYKHTHSLSIFLECLLDCL